MVAFELEKEPSAELFPETSLSPKRQKRPLRKRGGSSEAKRFENNTASSTLNEFGTQGVKDCHLQKHYLGIKHSDRSRAVWVIRSIFLSFLVAVAAGLGCLGYFLVSDAETDLGEQQYDAITDRALDLAKESSIRKRVVARSMAQVAASAFPDASSWPNVAIPAFETFARDLISTSDILEIGFYPMVIPESVHPYQQAEFEAFANFYFFHKRSPPFKDTSFIQPFIWFQQNFRATTVNTTWGSDNEIFFPELQNSNQGVEGTFHLLYNVHHDATRGGAIDEVLKCSSVREQLHEDNIDCAVVTRINYFDRSSFFVEPIYPANDPFQLTGVIISKISWDLSIARLFAETPGADGLNLYLEGEGRSYSYRVLNGETEFVGEDVSFGSNVHTFARTVTVGSTYYSNHKYRITVYPSEDFFTTYSTGNPMLVTIGAIVVVMLTSCLFFLYDFVVRREFNAKQHLLESKRRFMRFVSHEVRTPLNAVTMGLALLHEEFEESRNDREAPKLNSWFALLEDIQATAASSVDVLNDLLNYDKIEMGLLSLEKTVFSMWSLVSETSNEFLLSAKKKNISFKLDLSQLAVDGSTGSCSEEDFPPHIRNSMLVGDRFRMVQVLRNLLSNAIKFTPNNGTVTVKVTWIPTTCSRHSKEKFILQSGAQVLLERNGSIEIQVIDNGVGLSEDQLARLGREGIQFNVNELQAGNGSGLGLYISKGIVLQHGGKITVASEGEGRGACFTLTLPLHLAPTDAHSAESSEACLSIIREEKTTTETSNEETLPLQVLVVDDVATNRKFLSRLVRKRGHIVDEAQDGREAVDLVQEALEKGKHYDVILMDYEMPVLLGPDAAREIRGLGADSFIVGVTGNILPEDVRHFVGCGANTVLPKPVNINKLEELWTEHGVTAGMLGCQSVQA